MLISLISKYLKDELDVYHHHNPVLPSFLTYPVFVTRVTRLVLLMEQKLINFQGHLSSPLVFRVAQFLVFVCGLFRQFFPIVFSVVLRFRHSDYPFAIFKLFSLTIIFIERQSILIHDSCSGTG